MAVCGRRGRQAAGIGGVRGLAGRGGVICQSEHRLDRAGSLSSVLDTVTLEVRT